MTLLCTLTACGHNSPPPATVENTAAGSSAVASDPTALGKTLYIKKGCTACHTVDGSPRVGPSWKQPDWGKTIELASGGSVTMDESYLRESILSPQAKARPGYPTVMPSFDGQLRDDELAGLIAYIKSLKQP